MLFDSPSDDSPVCIADFGFAKFVSKQDILISIISLAEEESLSTPCGTPGYVGTSSYLLSSLSQLQKLQIQKHIVKQ